MFLGVFGFLVSILASYLKFLFNTTLDNTTTVTWGGLFLAFILVSVILKFIFGEVSDDMYADKYVKMGDKINEKRFEKKYSNVEKNPIRRIWR